MASRAVPASTGAWQRAASAPASSRRTARTPSASPAVVICAEKAPEASARTAMSSARQAGRPNSHTSRKMPQKRQKSWSSSQEPEHQRYTSTANRFSPGRTAPVASNSAGVKLSSL